MASNQISPEKITHPFQLMAAWFVMLIALVTLLLTAAAKIDKPDWAPAFLIISAVALSVLVIGAVFVMLTRFRPHLQGPKEYASWLKDQGRFSDYSIRKTMIGPQRPIPASNEARQPVRGANNSMLLRELNSTDDSDWTPDTARPFFRHGSSTKVRVEISNLPGAVQIIRVLQNLGFSAHIYQTHFEEDHVLSKKDHASIWVGSEVPAADAIRQIKTVISIWPHLCYMHLSTDSAAPEDIDLEMYFGGSTQTARQYGLSKWTNSDLADLPESLSQEAWHNLIRSKYPESESIDN